MQEQIDPGGPRAESMPHRNPELQVWGGLPTPESDTCRVPAKATALTPVTSTTAAVCKPESQLLGHYFQSSVR